MRKKGRFDLVRFLRGLVGRARSEEGVPPHVKGLVNQKGRLGLAPFDAGYGAGVTGIEDGDADGGLGRLERVEQLLVAEVIARQKQALFVGVSRVVKQYL